MNIKQLKLLIKDLPDDTPVVLYDSCVSYCDPDIKTENIEVRTSGMMYTIDENIDYENLDETHDYRMVLALTIAG